MLTRLTTFFVDLTIMERYTAHTHTHTGEHIRAKQGKEAVKTASLWQ